MKKGLILMVLLAFVVSGCAMTEGEKKGAAAGGALGAITGAVIGHQSGETGEGAAIGGAIGALAGTVAGRKMEEARKNNPNHLHITKIVEMSNEGVPDKVIIDNIERTDSVYYLNSETIDYLKKKGVSDKVVDYMLSTSQK